MPSCSQGAYHYLVIRLGPRIGSSCGNGLPSLLLLLLVPNFFKMLALFVGTSFRLLSSDTCSSFGFLPLSMDQHGLLVGNLDSSFGCKLSFVLSLVLLPRLIHSSGHSSHCRPFRVSFRARKLCRLSPSPSLIVLVHASHPLTQHRVS